MNTQLTVYISKQLKLPSLLPFSTLFNTPKNERICQSFIGNRLPEVYNRGGCTLKHCGEKISDPSMEELNTKDDETNITMRIPTSCHYPKHPRNEQKSKLLLQSMTIPINPCGMRMHFFWPLQSKLYEFVLLGEYQWLFSPFRCPFFGTQMWPKCELRFLPTVMVSSRHRILACWSFTSWELPRAWRPQILCKTSQNYTGEASEGYGCRT